MISRVLRSCPTGLVQWFRMRSQSGQSRAHGPDWWEVPFILTSEPSLTRSLLGSFRPTVGTPLISALTLPCSSFTFKWGCAHHSCASLRVSHRMNKKKYAAYAIVFAVLAVLVYLQFRTWRNFDWALLFRQSH